MWGEGGIMKMIDEFSCAAVPIFMNYNNVNLSYGTAFFYKRSNGIFLITNWHNLSGRNPISGQPMDTNGSIPDSISLHFHLKDKLGTWSSLLSYKLYSEDHTAIWLQHPIHGQKIDVAVMKIQIPEELTVYAINEMPLADNMRIEIGMDVFVLGFPIKFFTDIFPIWKKATIATEHAFDVDRLPKFLIDTATQKGMSGSPVILRERSAYRSEEGDMIMGGGATRFLGVYSGRYQDNSEEDDEIKLLKAQLGMVWKKIVIDEIIDAKVPGSFVIN